MLSQQDYDTLQDLVANMLGSLEETAQDDLIRELIPLARREERQVPGWSQIEIDMNWLVHAIQGMTLKDIAGALKCSPWTVRRCLLEHNLAEPAPPVIQNMVQLDGTIAKEWHPTGPMWYDLKDDPGQLDDLVRDVLSRYSNYSVKLS